MRRLPLAARPRARRAAGLAAVGLALLATAFLALRDSPVVAVRDVSVSGATGPDAPRIAAALEEAARDMTTLHVRRGALRDAVARWPTVARVEVERDLPRALRLRVVERTAVGVIGAVPVAADGTLLRGATAAGDLPALAVPDAPAAGRVDDPRARRLVELMAAAPPALRRRAERAAVEHGGLVVTMREGPEVVFGGHGRLRAKWAATARVLADPSSEGARSLDVRVPERPAAAGLPPLAEEAPGEPSSST